MATTPPPTSAPAPAPTSAPTPPAGASPDLVQAAAVAAAKGTDVKAGPGEKKPYPARAYVRTATGDDMVHLHTGETITGSEKKIEIDSFAISQLDAGKWLIVDPNA